MALRDTMTRFCHTTVHQQHAFSSFLPLVPEGLTVTSRRNMLKASLAGMAGLTVPRLLEQRARGAAPANKSVILLWMTGGPSHIDTWDPKPERPSNNRGPFAPIATALPGAYICEHLPKQAAMLDKFTVIRSADPTDSNHEPTHVWQTGNRAADPRLDPIKGPKWPAIGSIIAKQRGFGSGMPQYVTFQRSTSHIAFGGYLGKEYDPFPGNRAARLPEYDLSGVPQNRMVGGEMFEFARGLSHDRLLDRAALRADLDALRRDIDQRGSLSAIDEYSQQAVEMVVGSKAQTAFDLSQEPEGSRRMYGDHLWCQQALLARRLVEAGSAFVTVDLSYHSASGQWDTHGGDGPFYGGIENGLRPILPLFDHLLTTLVSDLEGRGKLDDVLVIAMGEFGRTPVMGTAGEERGGRNHWPQVMSMCLAGGGLRHGQVIGASEPDGGHIASRPVTPGDLAATIYRHMGVPLEATFEDDRGRPHPIVQNNGQPLVELF